MMKTKVKLSRYEYILNKSLKNEITYKESRNIISKENTNYNFPTSNGDTININNIVGENKKSKFVQNFYKSLEVYTDKSVVEQGKSRGELNYYCNMDKTQINNREKILKLVKINKSIFDTSTSMYKLVLKKIKEDYNKKSTKEYNRKLTSGKSNTAANYSINYENNLLVLTYERFIYEDIYKGDKIHKNAKLKKKIKSKLKLISGIELIEKYEKDFKENCYKKITSILESSNLQKEKILTLVLGIENITKLKEIEKFIIKLENQ